MRDPLTGKRKQVSRDKEEQVVSFREDLVILDKETWKKAQVRWKEIDGCFPVLKKARKKQRSYIKSNPKHLLAGLLKCHCCEGPMVLVSGKGSGYYGCYNSKRKTCDNKLLVSRKSVEKITLNALQEKLLTLENIQYVFDKVEQLIKKGMGDLPQSLRNKRREYEKSQKEIQNYLNFIKSGNFSEAVATALNETEKKIKQTEEEIKSLEFQETNTFKAPPKEWINHRLEQIGKTLEANTTGAAIALKKLLEVVHLEPISTEKALREWNDEWIPGCSVKKRAETHKKELQIQNNIISIEEIRKNTSHFMWLI